MNNETGGTAFPLEASAKRNAQTGMTLRDYFAAKAMQAMISTAGAPCLFGLEGCEINTAQGAYKVADAMLAARSQS